VNGSQDESRGQEATVSKLKYLVFLVAVMMAPGLALAQPEPPKWSYIEAGYTDFNPDNGDKDNGWYAAGSMKLFKNFHLVAEYDDVGAYTFWNAGGGWHGLGGKKADLYAQVVWSNIKVDEGDINEDGYTVQGGIRWKLIKWFELKLQANWVNYGGDVGEDTTGEVGALFVFLKDRIGIGADWTGGSDSKTGRAFLRFNFGK
jgi:hypothetical protein